MASYIKLALCIVIFYICSASQVSAADFGTCLSQETEELFSKTIPDTLKSFQAPKECTQDSPSTIVSSFESMVQDALSKCDGGLACMAEDFFKYQYGLLKDAGECEKELLLNGPVTTIIKTAYSDLEKCVSGVTTPMPKTTLLPKLL